MNNSPFQQNGFTEPGFTGPGPGGEFWDFAGDSVDYGALPVQPDNDTAFTMGAEAEPRSSALRPLLIALVVLLIGVVAFFAYEYTETGENPLAHVMTDLETIYADVKQMLFPVPPPPSAKPKVAKAKPKPKVKPMIEKKIDLATIAPPENPYWQLPNQLQKVVAPQVRPWSAEEEEGYRLSLSSRYTYQRFRAVQDVRKARLRGAESIFWDALLEKKLWTRMFAVIGLAEFGIGIQVDTIERAIGNERSELIANFFKRFIGKANEGQQFVLRHAIKVVDDRARAIIHQALWTARGNPYRKLYLVAGSYDPGPRVQRFVRKTLRNNPIRQDEWDELRRVVLGLEEPSPLLSGKGLSGTGLSDAGVSGRGLNEKSEPDRLVQKEAAPAAMDESSGVPASMLQGAEPAEEAEPTTSKAREATVKEMSDAEDTVEFYDMIDPVVEDLPSERAPLGLKETFDL